jgi:hypothetical protein
LGVNLGYTGRSKNKKGQVHWLIPVISATWKVELGGFRFKTSSSHKTKQNKKLMRPYSKEQARCGDTQL